ncbi:electron transfer flavoprotein [Mesobacillus boroniphilus JCM 21738]|uniref:Electron transfer flavoprotein n=1 Tax=Mesobacillus boroniphilus JCM 21738 TaxID=1294265 RepID=W4RNT0_9BACI|nr:electron transfer flavoprotein [Mesobacillus boroniphilus JCM 21738]
MSNSKVIVAINKDPEANIFKVADTALLAIYSKLFQCLLKNSKSLK